MFKYSFMTKGIQNKVYKTAINKTKFINKLDLFKCSS